MVQTVIVTFPFLPDAASYLLLSVDTFPEIDFVFFLSYLSFLLNAFNKFSY